MDEEVKTENTEVVVDTTPQVSEIEQKALEMGWKPKDQFAGDEADFIDAKEFVRRKPLFERIDRLDRTIRSQNQAIEAMKSHYSKVEQAAYQRALKELQAKQKTAIKEGDLEQYHEIQTEIDNVKEQAAEAAQVPQTKTVDPAFEDWRARNTWYQNDAGMTDYADQVGIRLAQQGMEPHLVLKEVEKRVRETFAHKFQNPNRQRPGTVETTNTKGAPTKETDYPLTDTERKIMNDLVRQKVMTKAEYIADLKKIKGEV